MIQKIFFTLLLLALSRVTYGSYVLVGDEAFGHRRTGNVPNNFSIYWLTNGKYSCPTDNPYICSTRGYFYCMDYGTSIWYEKIDYECERLNQKFTFDEKHLEVFCAMTKNKVRDNHDYHSPFETSRCLVVYQDKTKYFSVREKVKIDQAFTVNTVHYDRIFCDDKEMFEKEMEKLKAKARQPTQPVREPAQPLREPVQEQAYQRRPAEKEDTSFFEENMYYIIAAVGAVILAIGGMCVYNHFDKPDPFVMPFSDYEPTDDLDDEQETDLDTKNDTDENDGDQKDQTNTENDQMSFAQYLERKRDGTSKNDDTDVATDEAEHATEEEEEEAPDMDIKKDVTIMIEESTLELINEALPVEFSSDLDTSTEVIPEPTNNSEFTI